jgi:hypothetical protein
MRIPGVAVLAVALCAGACSSGEAPGSVAERFWQAVQEHDRETVLALSIEAEGMSMNLDDEGTAMENLRLGETNIDGDQAFVETQMSAVTEDRTLDLAFETALTKRDGQWLVDLDETGSRMMKSVLGVSMQELGEAMAEGMKDAMEGVAEGMAEGMKELGEAMGDAAKEAGSGSDDHR